MQALTGTACTLLIRTKCTTFRFHAQHLEFIPPCCLNILSNTLLLNKFDFNCNLFVPVRTIINHFHIKLILDLVQTV